MIRKVLTGLALVLFGAAISFVASYFLLTQYGVGILSGTSNSASTKIDEIKAYVDHFFVEEVDVETLDDIAANAVVDALGDEWSYYLTAEEYLAHQDQSANSYVGIGVTIQHDEEENSFIVTDVAPNGPAEAAGIQAGDIILEIDGNQCAEIGLSEMQALVRGTEGTDVNVTVLRDGDEILFVVTRAHIDTVVATYEMLETGDGLVTISNFGEKCAEETIEAIDALVEQGAKSIIFDLRFNPGGYKNELVEILDYILPEGVLFQSEDYSGKVSTDYSDAACIDLPMAVLVNADSYSAAEFFAAALQEYNAAVIVGEQTCGKGYYQATFELSDGSAIGLSIGKYYTPEGISLIGVGITPDYPVEITDEEYESLFYGELSHEEDKQLEKAIAVLN